LGHHVVIETLTRFLTRRAATCGHAGGRTGSNAVVQRFSLALDLNLHFHRLLLDGMCVADGDSVRWVRGPPPTTDEVQQLVTHMARTVEGWLHTQGYGADESCQEDVDDDADGVFLSASVAGRVALGVRAGAATAARGCPPIPIA
jgi:hypothetical protein